MRWIVLLCFTLFCCPQLLAQRSAPINLLKNGNFELGDEGFSSEYMYNNYLTPGSYAITFDAATNNSELRSPVTGDHTKGRGIFFVSNADGSKGKKVWCSTVKVIPNSMYEFTAYFCNVYALLPAKTNFAFEDADTKGNDPVVQVTIGSEVIAEEKDFFHLFRWLKVTGTWYSGTNKSAEICIENLNRSVAGNDLALDDISFFYQETMPVGYQPPKKTVTLVDRYYVPPADTVKKKIPLSTYGEFEWNDTVTDGVFVLHQKKWHPIVVDTTVAKPIERITLKSLIFEQTKADLVESTTKELDLIVQWLQRDSTVRVRFIGHTDNQGDPALNVKLSEQRVFNVKQYLVSKGIAADRIETVGYGGAYPIGDNGREETRKLNRRVEMEILMR